MTTTVRKFSNLNKTVVTSAKHFVKTNGNIGILDQACCDWFLQDAARAYDVERPSLSFREGVEDGYYLSEGRGHIVLGPRSTTAALFRNFRKHLQNREVDGTKKTKADSIGYAEALLTAAGS